MRPSVVLRRAMLAACIGVLTTQVAFGQNLPTPMDSAVSVGTLPNGVRYYVRHNRTPPARAELRLVVQAGSVLEDDDQRGMAHFVEHMAFNGTTHFPRKALVAYLESIGMRFGADLNASTSTDETVYRLTVPTDSAPLDTALIILRDWAGGIQFDSADVVAERRVIEEEWRLRTGPGARVIAAYDSTLYAGTPYPVRAPIGTVASIEATNPAPLKRFYRDWYRPDLLTVVAVGDFDQRRMVANIAALFSSLPEPAHPRPRPVIPPILPTRTTVSLVVDSEASAWSVNVLWPRLTVASQHTAGTFRAKRTREIFVNVVNARLGQLLQKPGTPLLSAALSDGDLHRGARTYELVVTTTAGAVEAGLTAAIAEIQRIARDGMTAGELDQQRAGYLRQATDVADSAFKQRSVTLADQYADNALQGSVSFSHAQVTALLRATVPTITVNDITGLARALQADSTPYVLVSVPRPGPTAASLAGALAAAQQTTLPPYDTRLVDGPLVAYPPTPGTITSTRSIASLGVTEWRLSNGVRVLLRPQAGTGTQTVFLAGIRPGGVDQASPADYASAEEGFLTSATGAGTYTSDDIKRQYAGVTADVATNIGPYDAGMAGTSGVRAEDVRLLLQLTYLKFTAPRLDTLTFARWKAQASDTTHLDVAATLLNEYLRNGRPFGRPIVGRVADSVDARRTLAFYRAEFGEAAAFTFVITGGFTLDAIRPLVEQYLGGLPSHGTPPTVVAIDTSAHPRAGPVRHLLITNETEPRSRTTIVYTAPVPYTAEDDARVSMLTAVVQQRLRETLRTRLGGVYAVDVASETEPRPYPRARLTIAYIGDPTRVDELHGALLADLDSLEVNGPTEAELRDAREAARRDSVLADGQPAAWAQRLLTYANGGWSIDSIGTATPVTGADLRDLARTLFTDARRIEVLTVPRPFVTLKSNP